jgi:hypothetical protein
MSTIHSPFSSQFTTANFSSILIVFSLIFHLDCTRWCRFTFLTHFGNKAHAVKGELHQLCDYITNIIIHTHMTDGNAVMPLSAAMDHIRQIMLNWKLSHKFEKWCKFSSCIKVKSGKKKSHKMRPACTVIFGLQSIVQTAEFSPVTVGPDISKASYNKNYEPQ